jgi:hypothetical protein
MRGRKKTPNPSIELMATGKPVANVGFRPEADGSH